jgi:protein-S-isoprenylcysteine O-methyltransferase Ste14
MSARIGGCAARTTWGRFSFWVGNWVTGLVFYTSIPRWVASLAGLVCIVLIMLGSTKRLEAQQDERYGDRLEYQTYVQTVPILIPFIPVYSFRTMRVYLG